MLRDQDLDDEEAAQEAANVAVREITKLNVQNQSSFPFFIPQLRRPKDRANTPIIGYERFSGSIAFTVSVSRLKFRISYHVSVFSDM